MILSATDVHNEISGYRWDDSNTTQAHEYLLPAVFKILSDLRLTQDQRRIFDLGCGNGSVAVVLAEKGYDVIGVDPSTEGIAQAKQSHPSLKVFAGSAYDDLAGQYGHFPVVISLEVVEHVYFPRNYATCVYSLVDRGGVAIVSTPYHGYWKNLALALTGRLDAHFTALWDYGHIKFWSFKTLRTLLLDAGFSSVQFRRVGRIPALAKSMIAIARK